MKPRLLDLFCCAGGAGMGYHLAGFEVVGVDIEPQPRYPFEFHEGDAMTFPLDGFDAVHASPPCHDWTGASGGRVNDTGWMLPATVARLAASGLPYVVENVPGPAAAHMPAAATLCGAAFGIARLKRHRLFAVDFPVMVPPCPGHRTTRPIGVYGELGRNDRDDRGTHGYVRRRAGVRTARELLGCPWMEPHELSQAIPPAYTRFIGEQLLTHLTAGVTS